MSAALLRLLFFGFDVHPIPQGQLVNLKKYKYSGVDLSLLSKYVLGPYWNWLVTCFPLWMAPNLITLLGLLAMVSAAVLVLGFAALTPAGAPVPPFLYIYTALSMFIYQSLDAIDGKQARRTNNMGPLGELFDHGCDALNLILQSLIIPILFRVTHPLIKFAFPCSGTHGLLHSSKATVSLPCIAFVAFYFSTWEEYHTGALYLGYFSGPVDGQILSMLVFLAAPLLDDSLWTSNLRAYLGVDLQLNTLIMATIALVAGMTAATSVINVVQAKGAAPLLKLIPFVSFVAVASGCFFALPAVPHYRLDYHLFVLALGLAFASAVFSAITAHVSRLSFPQWSPTFVPAAGSVALLLVLSGRYGDQVPSTASLLSAVLLNGIIYGRLAYCTINQMCNYLRIRCLKVRPNQRLD